MLAAGGAAPTAAGAEAATQRTAVDGATPRSEATVWESGSSLSGSETVPGDVAPPQSADGVPTTAELQAIIAQQKAAMEVMKAQMEEQMAANAKPG
eukprot:8101278-Pyramimonas_sp.AAC.1